jgi:hypothetical protein
VVDLIDRRIASIAFKQHGNITRRQLLELGLSSSGIAHRIRLGMLYPVFRGVYAVGCSPQTPVQRAAAAVLACGPRAALGGSSAMTLWGFWRRWDRPFEVVVTSGHRHPKGIRVHRPRNLERRDIRTQFGIRVTSPARTMLDIAARRNDRQFRRDVNNALHSVYLNKGALVDLLERHPRHPAASRLAWFVTTDASWPQLGVVLELDSWEYHNQRFDFETDHDRDLDYIADDLIPARLTGELMMHIPNRTGERLRRFVEKRRRYRRAA